MKSSLNKSQIERFSRQLVLKNIGAKGQKKILSSKILIVGVGGLGCPAAENLVRAGIGTIGLIDNDIVNLSNIHRQSLFNSQDVTKLKVNVAAKKLKDTIQAGIEDFADPVKDQLSNIPSKTLHKWLEAGPNGFRRNSKRLLNLDLIVVDEMSMVCLLYTSPSPRDKRQSRMPSSA